MKIIKIIICEIIDKLVRKIGYKAEPTFDWNKALQLSKI